ncbi:hypothetical protein HUJ04_007966 [Dendroctonus ponderosae]|nr:hypothetical protein HUJ04_007966 [Dendroctonus ponderosae]
MFLNPVIFDSLQMLPCHVRLRWTVSHIYLSTSVTSTIKHRISVQLLHMANKSEVMNQVIFSEEFNGIFSESVHPVLLEGGTEDCHAEKIEEWVPESSEQVLACSCCRVTFPSMQQQREHYKLDWHRYNLKQSLLSKVPIGEEEFNSKTENDEVSSISGSDSEDDDPNTLDTFATSQGKIFLQNGSGQVISLYRGVLLVDKKEEISTVNFYQRYKDKCGLNKQWAIIMLGGGHFAAAIFNGLSPILHKTFHCYTVRSGQGGTQSGKDGKSGGSHPKSAGASLRRYNEQALNDHVGSILTAWSEELKNSSLIFYRASGPYNRGVLFGEKSSILNRTDPRLRTIPFSTGRATFSEVKRVHSELCSSTVYESLNEAASRFAKQNSPERNAKKKKSSCINRAKSRELVQRALPAELSRSSSESNASEVNLAELKIENEDEYELNCETVNISFEDLAEFGDSLTPQQRKRGPNRKKPRKSKNQKLREKEEARKKTLIDALIKGNPLILEELFQERLKTFEQGTNVSKAELSQEVFNEILDEDGNSFLHLAAINEHEELLLYLLNNEGDPCLKNKNQQTPYSCTSSKVSRDTFRKFAKDNPQRHNYNKAQIPVNALTDEELAEKRRALRKVKKEKEKEKKKENHIKHQEEEQKNRFLHLTDREKRALAAERRILNSQGKVVARCFLCGADMAGKVPFEYLENRFCSIDCLKAHRIKTISC